MKINSRITQPMLYGLPSWPLAMLGIPLYVYLPTYYYELGVEMALVGLMLLLARVTDVVSDPLIGWWRDRLSHRGRYGLMTLGWGLLLVSLWQLLLPNNPSAWHLLVWALLVYLAWTFIMIPYQALSAEVTQEHHYKTRFTASREAFAILGVVSVLLLPLALSDPNDTRLLFSWVYPIVAISLTLGLALMMWRLNLVALPTSASGTASNPSWRLNWAQAKQAWWLIKYDSASRQLWPAYFINSLANAFPATLFLLFVQHYLDLTPQTGVLLMTFFLAGVFALPFWVKLSSKIGKYAAWRTSILLACLSFGWVFTLQSGDLYGFMLISFLSGLSLGADVALPGSIQADIAQDLSQNQVALSGLLFGVWGMLTKLALALAVGLAFPLLDWMGWDDKSAASFTTLVWLYAGIPILLKLGVLVWLRKAR